MWLLYYGEDPWPLVIDHINRDHSDNRIDNLRAVTPAVNSANREACVVANVHHRQPVVITYPDGRGRIVTDSLKTAGTLLRRSPTSLKRTIERDGVVYWGRGPWGVDSGIRVAWEHT
jgi:hypothetical protein